MYISPFQNIHMALTQVGAHRFRSLLTVLGIVIGITTVVTVVSTVTTMLLWLKCTLRSRGR